jgi:hypothetical protein
MGPGKRAILGVALTFLGLGLITGVVVDSDTVVAVMFIVVELAAALLLLLGIRKPTDASDNTTRP